jgi:hypothetical protein
MGAALPSDRNSFSQQGSNFSHDSKGLTQLWKQLHPATGTASPSYRDSFTQLQGQLHPATGTASPSYRNSFTKLCKQFYPTIETALPIYMKNFAELQEYIKFYVPQAYILVILHLMESCRFSKRICFPGRL